MIRTVFLLLLLTPFKVHGLVVLQYHHIGDTTPYSTSLSVERFEQHLKFIKQQGYQVWPLRQLVQSLRRREPLPDKTLVITFDDGYSSVYNNALPLLKKYNWPFTVFVNPQSHDQERAGFMTWSQLREIQSKAGSIGNHSMSHAHLTRRLDGETRAQWLARVRLDIESAQRRLLDKLGEVQRVLAYPYGEFNAQLQSLLKDMDYIAFAQHSGPVSLTSERQALPRFSFGGDYGDLDDFATKVRSLAMPIASVERKVDTGSTLADGHLDNQQFLPSLLLKLPKDKISNLNCFASGQGLIKVEKKLSLKVNEYEVRAKKAIPVGRSRYICTAKSAIPGRFYWYSQPWLRAPKKDGNWPD